MEKSNIHIIIKELDAFIRKFYVNELIKGFIVFVLIGAFYFSAISLVEYFAFFTSDVRTIVFYISVALAVFTGAFYVVRPLVHLCKIGKILTHYEAAKIISKFFPEIQDVLLNTLELAHDKSLENNELAIAAINQKIVQLKPIPFVNAVNFKKLLRFWKPLVVLFVVILLVSLFFPRAFIDGATRIVKHTEHFEKQAPFKFILDNDSLTIIKGGDFAVLMHVEGFFVPERVNIQFGGNTFLMTKKSNTEFEYVFKGCNNSLAFSFVADEIHSQVFEIQVIPLPQLLNFTIDVKVPTYTQLENFSVSNTADITFPAGSKLMWNVQTADSDSLFLCTKNSHSAFSQNQSQFTLNQLVTNSMSFTIVGKNEHLDSVEIIGYNFTVIPDVRPAISVKIDDNVQQFLSYDFAGTIRDDYGFTSLEFVYVIENEDSTMQRIPLQILPNSTYQRFAFNFDFSEFPKGKNVNYYFEVFDNDQVNGKKSARTSVFTVEIPSDEEIETLQEQYSEQVANSAAKSAEIAHELVKELQKAKQKLLDQNLSDWEKNQAFEEIKRLQDELQKATQNLSNEMSQKNNFDEKFSLQNQQILEKQRQIEDLLKSLNDNQLGDFNFELMQNLQQKNWDELMTMSLDELSEQLDRDLELLKLMDVEQSLEKTQSDLRNLSQEQQKLSEDLKKAKNPDEINQKFNELNQKLSEIQDDYKQTIEKNEKLQDKFTLEDFSEQFREIQNSMQQSSDENSQKQNAKSSKSMKNAAQQSQDLANKMEQMVQQQTTERQMEDMENLRRIMENLLTVSFKQEEMLTQLKTLPYQDPRYADVALEQGRLREHFSHVKDSLYALSKRVTQISAEINEKLYTIQSGMKNAVSSLEDRNKYKAQVQQQSVMQAANDLSLLLSEVLEQMQQSAAEKMQGQQQCQNPNNMGKNGKPSLQQMRQMQENLKKQMEQMLQQMQSGQMPSQAMQKMLSQMLMKQQMLQQMANQMKMDGGISPQDAQQLSEIQKVMERNERDIINQNVSQQTLMRQEQILSRMLEMERAEKERDKSEERESKSARDLSNTLKNQQIEQVDVQKNTYDDEIQVERLKLKNQYQKIFNEYLINLNENN